jgi:FAD/FMN-containing dehydrogenase
VVTADGVLIRTGSGASSETPAYFRQYGPDATGLFLSENGAMGFKTRAVLRLIPFPSHQAYGSFAFATASGAIAAISAIGRSGLAGECYGWDPYFVRLMAAASAGAKNDLRVLWNIVKAGSGLLDGLFAAARVAMAGRRPFSGEGWLVHVAIDDVSAAGASAKLKRIRALARQSGGKEVAPSAPRALRAAPFTNFNTPERRTSLRNLPTNSLSPHSRAQAVFAAVQGFLAENGTQMDHHGIQCGVIVFAVGGQALCIEPLLYWHDEEHALHNRVAETSDVNALADYTARPARTTAALALREGLKATFRRHGCLHVQIGRAYPWRETRDPATLGLISAVKSVVDPEGLINRGALGFDIPERGR